MVRAHPLSLLFAAAVFACGGDDGDDGDTRGTSGGIPSPTSGTADASSSESAEAPGSDGHDSTGGELPGDPAYPRPDPVDEAGMCPGGYFGPITFDGAGWLCLPPCEGEAPQCPDPQTGDAVAECATNPLSSAAPCADSTDCDVAGEMCGNIGGGQSGCLLPPSHCILRCDEGETCPDGLVCAAGPGICQYEA